MPTKRFRLYATLLLGVIVLSWAVYWAFFEREHHHWTDKVQLLNGNTITVTHHASERTYHGHPHAFGWGGGDPYHEMRFVLPSNRTVTWEGKFIPIVLELQDQVPYLVVFDRETDFRKARFRYYRFHNDWEDTRRFSKIACASKYVANGSQRSRSPAQNGPHRYQPSTLFNCSYMVTARRRDRILQEKRSIGRVFKKLYSQLYANI